MNEIIEHPIIINFNNNLELKSRKSKKKNIFQKYDNPPQKNIRNYKNITIKNNRRNIKGKNFREVSSINKLNLENILTKKKQL